MGRQLLVIALLALVIVAAAVCGGVWYMTGVPGRSHRGPLPPLGKSSATVGAHRMNKCRIFA